jgi:2-oxoglutarate ferredoxin oxidoreductase subunit gamma
MARTEIRVCGYGGQGVILSGYIIGKATAIFEGKNATLTQSFGPEARGSACSAQVICSDEPIHYPYMRVADILVAMSQEAYSKFEPELKKDGLLLVDEDLVKAKKPRDEIKLYSIPATRFAEELGRKIVLNIVMLGFFTAMARLVSHEAMEKAVLSSVPKGTEELNKRAFQTGYEYGMGLVKEEAPTPKPKPKIAAKPKAPAKSKPKAKAKASK